MKLLLICFLKLWTNNCYYGKTVWIVYTGSIPEREDEKIYNTCTVFGPQGDLLGKYRKVRPRLHPYVFSIIIL